MSLKEIDLLKQKIKRSTLFVVGVVILVVSFFIIKVWLLSDNQLSSDAEKWGQFGDYIGGLLNPLIAYLAFYWLTQSVLIQKQELAETKDALEKSAAAQLKQEIHTEKISKLNALNSLITSYNNDISNLRDSIAFLSTQLEKSANNQPLKYYYTLTGKNLYGNDAVSNEMKRIEGNLNNIIQERNKMISQIKILLSINLD